MIQPRRPVEIKVAPAVPGYRLVAVMDACIRVKIALSEERNFRDFRILVPTEQPFAVIQQVRLVCDEEPPPRGHVLMNVPGSEVYEPLSRAEEDCRTICVTWDNDTKESEIYSGTTIFSLAELKAWLKPIARSRIDRGTGASMIPVRIRCDRSAPAKNLLMILAVLAEEDVRIKNVLLEVHMCKH